MPFTKLQSIATIFGIAAITAGCANTRISTTPRTGIEQALMSQTARESVDTIQIPNVLSGMSYKVDDSKLTSPDKSLIIAQMEEKLLRNGMQQAVGDEVDITMTPYAEFSAVDDGRFLIGIPELTFPGGGNNNNIPISLPEIALFKRETQEGRNKIALYGTHTEDGSLQLAHDPIYSTRYYTRYTLLFFFRWNVSNLEKPFNRDIAF